MNLEERMFEDIKAGKQIGVDIPLEHALLIASGVRSERRLQEYLGKLDEIHRKFQRRYKPKPGTPRALSVAEQLYHFLMKGRKDNDDRFQLNRVIDAFLEGKDEPLGNCLGLTQFYSVIGMREGLDLNILYYDGRFIHVCNVINIGKRKKIIDLRAYPDLWIVHGDQEVKSSEGAISELVKNIYFSKGRMHQDKKRYELATRNYNLALLLDLNYHCAILGIGTIELEKAIEDKGRSRKHYRESIRYLRKAVSIRLDEELAYVGLSIVEEALGHMGNARKYCLLANRYNPTHPSVKRQMRDLSLA
jgi:tetratricopeptide (TPR) repeat protein